MQSMQEYSIACEYLLAMSREVDGGGGWSAAMVVKIYKTNKLPTNTRFIWLKNPDKLSGVEKSRLYFIKDLDTNQLYIFR